MKEQAFFSMIPETQIPLCACGIATVSSYIVVIIGELLEYHLQVLS
jgi:hypothetical protein